MINVIKNVFAKFIWETVSRRFSEMDSEVAKANVKAKEAMAKAERIGQVSARVIGKIAKRVNEIESMAADSSDYSIVVEDVDKIDTGYLVRVAVLTENGTEIRVVEVETPTEGAIRKAVS